MDNVPGDQDAANDREAFTDAASVPAHQAHSQAK